MGRDVSQLEQSYRDNAIRDNTKFDPSQRGMARSLSEMHRAAYNKNNGHQGEATREMEKWVQFDRRFDGFDVRRLVAKVNECRSNGATLDFDDPWLRGGAKRPGGILTGSRRIGGG
jgi:hypothetical protein